MTDLSIFGARSFWALVFSVAAQVVPWMTEADIEPMAGHAADAASGLLAIYAWYERRAPKRRLVVRGPVR